MGLTCGLFLLFSGGPQGVGRPPGDTTMVSGPLRELSWAFPAVAGPDGSAVCVAAQGVRTKTVKKLARVIIEKYYSRLTLDFHTNKRVVDEVAEVPSKRMRNKIAGFVTHLMKRIQRGPVRGISLKLQEEERERRLDFVPEVGHHLPSQPCM
jgi:ribosomal protein S17E